MYMALSNMYIICVLYLDKIIVTDYICFFLLINIII